MLIRQHYLLMMHEARRWSRCTARMLAARIARDTKMRPAKRRAQFDTTISPIIESGARSQTNILCDLVRSCATLVKNWGGPQFSIVCPNGELSGTDPNYQLSARIAPVACPARSKRSTAGCASSRRISRLVTRSSTAWLTFAAYSESDG